MVMMMKKKNKPALNWVAITGGGMGKSAGIVESTSRTTSLTTHWGKSLIQNLHQSTDSRSAGKVNNWQHWQKCKLKYIQYFQVYSSGGVSQTVCLYAWWQWRWQLWKPQPKSVPAKARAKPNPKPEAGGRQLDSQAFFAFKFCLQPFSKEGYTILASNFARHDNCSQIFLGVKFYLENLLHVITTQANQNSDHIGLDRKAKNFHHHWLVYIVFLADCQCHQHHCLHHGW